MVFAAESQCRKPLSAILPPLVLGTATFNHQYNFDPLSLPSTQIIHEALKSGIRAFDTSPYYGPAETLLGKALQSQSHVKRSDYIIQTKCGRIAAENFDYSPEWIRKSVLRSLERLGTNYLDVVFCHDVEFVHPQEVIVAVQTLRELRNSGIIHYIGISGYPTEGLANLAQQIKEQTGEPLDVVMNYAQYTLQNTSLCSKVLRRFVDAEVGCVLNGSPLGMGLLRDKGVPVGDLGDFHPAPNELRDRCAAASELIRNIGHKTESLETLALWFAIEGWIRDGAIVGTGVKPYVHSVKGVSRESFLNTRIGISVAGVSYLHELETLLTIWNEIILKLEREFLYKKVSAVLGDQWIDFSWESPSKGFTRNPTKIKSHL